MTENLDPALLAPIEKIARFIETGDETFLSAFAKEGVVIIDVGTTRVPDASRKRGYRLSGDAKYDEVAPKCSAITPVPGGVGPMTVISLIKNTVRAVKGEVYGK